MTGEHKTHDLSLEPCGACAMYDDALTQERDKALTLRCSCGCALCGSQWQWSCRIGVGIVQRHHASITYQLLNSHFQSNCDLVVRLYVVIVNSFL